MRAYIGLMLADAAAILAGFAFAAWLYHADPFASDAMLAAQLLIPLDWTAALPMEVYSLQSLVSPGHAVRRALPAMLLAMTAIVLIAFFTKSSASYSRMVMALGFFLALGLVLRMKTALRPLVERLCGKTAINKLVIDDGGEPLRVSHAYHIDSREHQLVPDVADPHMLDRIGLYLENMDQVIVTCPPERRSNWATKLSLGVTPSRASTRNSTRSASSMARWVCWAISSSMPLAASTRPPVSTTR